MTKEKLTEDKMIKIQRNKMHYNGILKNSLILVLLFFIMFYGVVHSSSINRKQVEIIENMEVDFFVDLGNSAY